MPPSPATARQGPAPTRILAPWIQSRGFGFLAIGALLALPPLFKMLAPWSWGIWADRSGKRRGKA